MKKLISAIAMLAVWQAPAHAQTQQELNRDNKGGSTDNVLTYGMGYSQNRYSALKEINKQTVKRLVPAWNVSTGSNYGEQGQPLVYNGVMYVTNADATLAIDIETGKQLWRTPVEWDPATPRVVCCGVSNKGPAIYNGKVFRGTLDAFVIALDQKTGKELWRQKAADWKEGFTITGAPLVANGVLITGMSGAEFGTRLWLDGWDPDTGKQLWRKFTIPGPGEKGHDTWPAGDAYLRGGGSTWITGSYDPDLDLVYWGTGNAGPWNPATRPGDNLYTASVIAFKPKTGEFVWHYQFAPNDMYDWDANWEMILGDLTVDGAKRKVVMQMNRNGFLYVLDRANGKLLSAKPFEKINWATHVDMATGRPVESDVSKRVRAGETVEVWPSPWGAKNWPHAAFNPETGLLYANTMHFAHSYRFVPVEYKPGQRYMGIENKRVPAVAGEPLGHVEAISPLSGAPAWRVPIFDIPNYAAVLASAGGLLFTGKQTGEFVALDIDSGKTLWQFQTGSGINAQPITFTHKGHQYVVVQSGLGGVNQARMAAELKNIPRGGSVWAFKVMDQ